MQQPSNPFWNSPWIQAMLSGAGGGGGGMPQGYNPFFNIYSPAPPGTSQTTGFPSPIAPPASPPPPVQPPPTSATITPMPTAPGAGGPPPIGQVPPMPAGAVASGQGSAAMPGMVAAARGATPQAVPPFQATMPPAPSLFPQPQQQATQTPGTPVTWTLQPQGTFMNPLTGQTGTPAPSDFVIAAGSNTPIPYSQFIQQAQAPTGAFSNQPQMGGGDRGAPQMGGTAGARDLGGPPGLGGARFA